MKTSYNKLFKLMIDRRIKKGELCKAAHISDTTLAKMMNGGAVTSNTLEKICGVLKCDIGDIMEMIPDNENVSKSGEY
ncbi:transcriptional regulator [Clostridia bacterium]|nr:transcriptional regulator [Clostridia bacterium]